MIEGHLHDLKPDDPGNNSVESPEVYAMHEDPVSPDEGVQHPPRNLTQGRKRSPARTGVGRQGAEIADPVADEGHRVVRQEGNGDLPDLPRIARLSVASDHLDVVGQGGNVQPAVIRALAGDI